MRYFTLAAVALAATASASCGDHDMECLCGADYNKWFSEETGVWTTNRCRKVNWWPLEEGTGARCYNLFYNDYNYPMRINPRDPYVDQVPAFYYEGYPLSSQIGAYYSVYWDHPRAVGIPCGFNFRNLARDMGKPTHETLRDGKAYIRTMDLRTPLINYYPVSMFRNTYVAEARLLLSGFRDYTLPTGFLDEDAKSHLIKLDVQQSFIRTSDLEEADFFAEYTGLRYAGLKFNDITTLNGEWFRNNDLYTLDLSHNDIEDIPVDFFQHMPNLEMVVLSRNHIVSIDKKVWNHTPLLGMIYASFNQLESVAAGDFNKLKKLNRVWLGGNQCTYEADNCKHGDGYMFSNVEFDSKRNDFKNWMAAQAGGDTAGVAAQMDHMWNKADGHWSRTSLNWASKFVPALTKEKIDEWYDPVDTAVGNTCSCN